MGAYTNYFIALGEIAKQKYSEAIGEYKEKLPEYLAALELFEEAQQKFFIDDKAYRERQEALRNWIQEKSERDKKALQEISGADKVYRESQEALKKWIQETSGQDEKALQIFSNADEAYRESQEALRNWIQETSRQGEKAQQKFIIADKKYRESQEALKKWIQETSGQDERTQQIFSNADKAYRESQEALKKWIQEKSGQGERPKTTESPRPPKIPTSPKIPREKFLCMGHKDNLKLEWRHLIYVRDDRVLPNERCLSLRKDQKKPRSLSFEKDPKIILEEIDCDLIPEWRFSFFFRVPDKSVLSLQNISDINQECVRELYNLFKEEVLAECESDPEKVNMPLPIEPGLLRISYGQGWQYKSFVVDADKFFEALYKGRGIKVLLDGEDICFERIVRYTLSENLKPGMITQKSNTMQKELQPESCPPDAQSA